MAPIEDIGATLAACPILGSFQPATLELAERVKLPFGRQRCVCPDLTSIRVALCSREPSPRRPVAEAPNSSMQIVTPVL